MVPSWRTFRVACPGAGVAAVVLSRARGLSAREEPTGRRALDRAAGSGCGAPASGAKSRRHHSDSQDPGRCSGRRPRALGRSLRRCHANDGSSATRDGKTHVSASSGYAAPAYAAHDRRRVVLHHPERHSIQRHAGMGQWFQQEDEQDSWKLVRFIRHLPDATAEEGCQASAAARKGLW